MTDATSAPTPEEMQAFLRDEHERAKRHSKNADAALSHYAEMMLEMMSLSQQCAVKSVVLDALRTADYFAKRPLKTEVTINRTTEGRKGSPWSTWWVSVKVDTDHIAFGAQGFGSIGKRGATKGTMYEAFGRSHELGR